MLPSHADRSEFAAIFANSYLGACGYRNIIYFIKKEQKSRKRRSSTVGVGCVSSAQESMHSSADNYSEKSYGSVSLADSNKGSPEKMAIPESLPPEASMSEETLEDRVQKYIELDMKTHVDFIQVKQSLHQDMEGLEYLMFLFL